LTTATEPSGWVLYTEERTRNRTCGGCQACCTAIPVELHPGELKPAGTRCPHQCSRGCSIYPERPEPCAYWTCRWLFDPATADLKRPDKGHYIIDCSTDTILIDKEPYSAMQVWIDPQHREAANDPALRAYIEHIGATYGFPTLVRFGPHEGYLLYPPSLTPDGQWGEGHTKGPLDSGPVEARLAELGQERFIPR
jgi:hypothetical protein